MDHVGGTTVTGDRFLVTDRHWTSSLARDRAAASAPDVCFVRNRF